MRRICWIFLLLAACGKPSERTFQYPEDHNIVDAGKPQAVSVNLRYDEGLRSTMQSGDLRWQLLSGSQILGQNTLSGQEKSLTFNRRLDSTTLRFEELVDGEWVLYASFDLVLDRDRTVTL